MVVFTSELMDIANPASPASLDAINRAMSSTGELTTHKGGALWHAWKVTADQPGASSDWQLMVKHACEADGVERQAHQ